MKRLALCLIGICLSTPGLAALEVRFDEGAPKDRFTIINQAACALGATKVTIDLSGSPYGLVFDVTSQGAGVEVFQPFELTAGAKNLKSVPKVADGDNRVTLDLLGLPAGGRVSFTIDVDDTRKSREITVSDQEIAGAKVAVSTDRERLHATFGDNATATVALKACDS